LSLWVRSVFELPALSAFVKFQARIIVAFVKIFEDAREYLWLIVGKIDALCRFKKLIATE
jgi:hypothetical protein